MASIFGMLSDTPLINIKNSKGPRMDLCGTPMFISLIDDKTLSMLTNYDLSVNCLSNRSITNK